MCVSVGYICAYPQGMKTRCVVLPWSKDTLYIGAKDKYIDYSIHPHTTEYTDLCMSFHCTDMRQLIKKKPFDHLLVYIVKLC